MALLPSLELPLAHPPPNQPWNIPPPQVGGFPVEIPTVSLPFCSSPRELIWIFYLFLLQAAGSWVCASDFVSHLASAFCASLFSVLFFFLSILLPSRVSESLFFSFETIVVNYNTSFYFLG